MLALTSKLLLHLVKCPLTSSPSLAYLEIYIVLAQIIRRFSLELYETDASDVELAHDFFLPSPKLDSKGVRVKVVTVPN